MFVRINISTGTLRVSMRRPYFFRASDKVGAGSDAARGPFGGAPDRSVVSSGEKVRLKSYWPSKPVSSTTGRLVKRPMRPTNAKRVAFGAVRVTDDEDPP